MPAKIDATGHVYGRLTAVRPTDNGWLFSCDCGGSREANLAHVRFGSVRSCGCLRKEATRQLKAVDLTGQRFGRLIVQSRIGPDKHGNVQWKCACDCGCETVGVTSSLRKGAKQSCGCLHREWAVELGKSSRQENPVSRTPEYKRALKKRHLAKPEKAMQARISRLFRFALEGQGVSKGFSTLERLGYSASDLVEHLERQFHDGMGWHNMREWQIDHIIPSSTARSEDDVVALNQLSNLRPMWADANNRKNNRIETLL